MLSPSYNFDILFQHPVLTLSDKGAHIGLLALLIFVLVLLEEYFGVRKRWYDMTAVVGFYILLSLFICAPLFWLIVMVGIVISYSFGPPKIKR
jgi:uncharacterized iron-regulated membrane protein